MHERRAINTPLRRARVTVRLLDFARKVTWRSRPMTIAGKSLGARVDSAWERLTAALDRHHAWPLAALAVLYFAVTAIRARATPFWHDEIYTLLLSRVPTVADVWRAARSGADAMPPLNLFLTRAAESLAGRSPIASRLPAMLGFCTMSVTVFYLVRARSTMLLAFAAMLMPWYTRAYRYSYEARGYGVMLGLFALLLWSWSEAALGRRRRFWLPVFAIVFAASLWNHYFAALTFVPVAAGEAYRWARRGAPDWPLWGAAAIGLAFCAPLVPLVRQASGQGATFWRHVTSSDVGDTYWWLFHDLWSFGPWALASLAGAVFLGLARGRGKLSVSIVPNHELVAGVVALGLPILAVGAGRVTGGYTPRYALSGVLPWVLAAPLALWWLSGRSRLVELVLVVMLLIGVVRPSADLLEHPLQMVDPVAARPLLLAQLRSAPPVVVAGAVQFLQLWYYAPRDLQSRLWYVDDPARSVRHLGSDTADRGYLLLARWAPVGIKTYDQLERQRSFTLYDDRTGWLSAQLQETGAVVEETAIEEGAHIAHVTMPDRSLSWRRGSDIVDLPSDGRSHNENRHVTLPR